MDPDGVSREIDAMTMDEHDEQARRLAALNVCATMARSGYTIEDIREVLASLGLTGLTPQP